MAWTPISNAVIQYAKDAAGTSASGYYLKFYASGTSTPFSMASASDGSGLLAKCQINSLGYPINGSGDVFIPHVNQDYRIVLYPTSADADANTFANAVFDVDGVNQQVIGDTADFVKFTDLSATTGSSLVNFKRSATAIARTVENIIKDRVPSIYEYGGVGNGTANDTAAFLAAYNDGNSVYIPAGTWRIDGLSITKPFRIYTDGWATIIHQNSGTAAGTRIFDIRSGDVFIDDIYLKGNTATDTGEQHHGIRVFSQTGDGAFRNIVIGNVYGKNIRGDVVYVGGRVPPNSPYDIKIGNVTADNCYRLSLAITGCIGADIGIVTCTTFGTGALDIEPDGQGGVVKNINVEGVRGNNCAILGLSPNDIWGGSPPTPDYGIDKNINIGFLDLDGTIPASVPSLAVDIRGPGLSETGLTLRNTKGIKIGTADLRNFQEEPIEVVFSGNDLRVDEVTIDILNIENSCLTSGTGYIKYAGGKSLKIGQLRYSLTNPATQYCFVGTSGATGENKTRLYVEKVVGNGPFAQLCYLECGYSNISYANDLYCVRSLSGAVLKMAEWNVGRIAGFNAGGITFQSSNLTWTGTNDYDASLGTSFHAVEINTTKNTVYSAIKVDNTAMTQP